MRFGQNHTEASVKPCLLAALATLVLAPLGEFSASSVVPAERFGPRQETSPSWWEVGSEEVVPRPAGAFRRGEPVRDYLQVLRSRTGPAAEQGSCGRDLPVRKTRRRAVSAAGQGKIGIGCGSASLGLALPARGWPAGRYRVVVNLRDRVTGLRTSTEGVFTIVD